MDEDFNILRHAAITERSKKSKTDAKGFLSNMREYQPPDPIGRCMLFRRLQREDKRYVVNH
jgi:hypothetical protein